MFHVEEINDPINPPHYKDGFSNGAQVIDITENLIGNRSNIVKYVARAGRKNPATEMEDLEKARWYLDREIQRVAVLGLTQNNSAQHRAEDR